MTLTKKCDVKTYSASQRNKGLHLAQQVEKPAVSLLPVEDMATEVDEAVFVEDFSREHCSPGGTVSAVVIFANSDDSQMPETHKTPRS